jgi:hypothetical protein
MSKARNNEEDKLQASIVLWFGQKWPEYQELLFEVYNNPSNIKHAMHRKSMGMRAGVADLILIQPKRGLCFGIEIKAPGSSHNFNEINHQIKWGENLIENGGGYIMTSNIELIKEFIAGVIENDGIAYFAMLEARKYIDNQLAKRKTIKF